MTLVYELHLDALLLTPIELKLFIAFFGNIGSVASEEVTLELVKGKCFPILLYGLDCFSLPKADLKSLDFVITLFA